MPYTYLEHRADVGIRAEGRTLEEAIESGVEAMLNVMFDLDTIKEHLSVSVKAGAPDVALLFVEVLNEVLSIQDRDGLALKRLETKSIKKLDGGYEFKGLAYGEGFNPRRHMVKTEVKAATYAGLEYRRGEDGSHILQCILDV